MTWVGLVVAFNSKGVFAELTTKKAEEHLAQVATGIGVGRDDNGASVRVEKMPRVHADAFTAMQAFRSPDCEQQARFHILEGDFVCEDEASGSAVHPGVPRRDLFRLYL